MWSNSSYVSKNKKKNVVLDYSRRFSAVTKPVYHFINNYGGFFEP